MPKVFFSKFTGEEQADMITILRKANNIAQLGSDFIIKIEKTGKKGSVELSDRISGNIQIEREGDVFDIEVELQDFSYASFRMLSEKVFARISQLRFGSTVFLRTRINAAKEKTNERWRYR